MKSNSLCSPVQSRRLAFVAGVFCLALAGGAAADEARPCAQDAARLCPDAQPGQGRIARCMKEHERELSPACRARVAEFREEAREAAEACQQDIQANCKGVQPGGGRIVQCLKAHEATLSPACRQELSARKGRR